MMKKEKKVVASPPAAELLYDRASRAIDEMNYDYAIKLLRTSLSINPNFSQARSLLAVARAKKLQVSSSLRRQIEGIILMLEAFFLESLKKWDRALEKYEYLFSIFPPQVPILPRMGDIYLQKGMTDKAMEAYRITLLLRRDDIYALLRLIELLRKENKIKEAVQHCWRYLKVKPNDFTVSQELKNLEALITIDKGKWEDESSFVEETAAPKSEDNKITEKAAPKTDIDSILLRAKTLFDQNRWDDAINEYRKVTSIAPDNIQAHQALGELYVRKRFFDKAIEEYERVLALDPKKKAVLTTLSNLYIREGNIARAIEKYEKMVTLFPEETMAYRLLGDLYLRSGNTERALKSYHQVAKLDPKHPAIHTIIGELYLKIGKVEKAIEEYRKQIALEPENSALIEHLGDLYLREGKLKEAKESYLKTQKLEPTKKLLLKKIRDVELTRCDHLIRHYELLLRSNPKDEKLKREIFNLHRNKLKMRITDAVERVKESRDVSLRLELGKLYLEGEMLDEALVEFQACLKEPSLQREALYSIGAVFEKKGMLDMAVSRLEEALAVDTGAVDGLAKDILYKLGNISEVMGKRERALSFYKKIYETDITYKDVSKKVESGYLKA